MTILFAGTPSIAVPSLEALVGAGHRVEVLTNPDAPGGRSGTPAPGPVKVRALELGLAIQKKYGIKIDADAKDTRNHFSNVASLAAFVTAKQAA